jgi:pimeloyl-ACP methyl ester carboxylesterase
LLLFVAYGLGQSYRPGPQVLTYFSDVDDSDQPYALYLPRAINASRKYPLVLSLHGLDSNHRLNLRRVFGRGNLPGETDTEASRRFPPLRDVDMIVASPLARGSMGYQGLAEKDVYDVLADVKRRFPIDEDRVYLTGLSLGGGGTLWLGLTRPDLWAAIAPVCPAVPPGVEELAPNALNLPVRLFHGDEDPIVPVAVSRRWQRLLLDLSSFAEYVEYPNVRHNSWDYAYRNGTVFDWFAQFHRDRFPERVRFVSQAYQYDSAYWVQFDVLTPGTSASIDARFTGPNRLEIVTRNLDGFTLNLAGHPRFSTAHPADVIVDGVTFRRKGVAVQSFSRDASGWKVGREAPLGGGKRPGAEGPIASAFASRHIYVYGTAGAPGREELEMRRQQAVRASEWSPPQKHLLVAFAVKADKEVTQADLAESNLILFGTRETNRIVARFADRLPISLNASAADYGLVFIFPAAGRYVVVNSGLPWWTGADEVDLPGLSFVPPAVRLLLSMPDYRLFKGSISGVVAEGRFDRNWKVPPPAAAAMRRTEAVVIR